MKTYFAIIYMFSLMISGCATMSSDTSPLALQEPIMDLSSPTVVGEPAPSTGLRNPSNSSGGNSCSACAH